MIFALVGNQNCGKTTLFNALTGSNQHVGNFPGVTVDQKMGEITDEKGCAVVDLPGIYSLRPYTQEEIVSRDFILNQKPDGMINIVDATNIERNLYLTLQLLELRIPMVLALNMMDEVRSNGGSIDVQKMSAALVMISLYLLGILIGIVAALIMNWSTFRGKPVPFVMELPNYRLPSLKSVALLLWEKAKDFLQRAFTVIFLATIIIWFLQSFDIRLNVVADSADSLLALIGRWIAPVFAPLGFADWRCATSLISGFIAKESVVSTLEVLLGGAPLSTMFTNRSAASFLVFTLLYTPCIAAVATIRREFDSTLKTIGIVLMQCCVAWIAASVVYALIGIL